MRIATLIVIFMLALLAGCNLLGSSEESPQIKADKEMRYLQMPLVANVQAPAKVRVAIMSVVDSSLLASQAEGEELDPEVVAQAARRERVVIQELRDQLTKNRLIELVTPDQSKSDEVRLEIQTAGHAGLSSATVMQLGQSESVDFLITGLVDVDGKEVNLVAQETVSGTHVYESTIDDWPILVDDTEGEGAG